VAESNEFLKSQMDRLNIPEDKRDDWLKNITDFSTQVRHIESDNNPMAAAGTTSAKGVYQFTDASVDTGRNRMRTLGYAERPDWNTFYANIFAQKGSDDFLRRIGSGDMHARKEAYYKFHHTAPDEATIRRVDELIQTSGMDELEAKKPKGVTEKAVDVVKQTMMDADRAESAYRQPKVQNKKSLAVNAFDSNFWKKDWRA
jgi:hypothetical protein